MKTKIIITLLVVFALGAGFVWLKQKGKVPAMPSKQVVDSTTQEEAAIRDFMAKPDLELTFVKTDVPFPVYFRVGKVTQVNGGENMEAVEGWRRKVNIYRQKELLHGQCSVYEYHIDPRNHFLVAVVIAGLTLSEIEEYKNNG